MSSKKQEKDEALKIYPILSQMKAPQWQPFFFETQIPETYIPKYEFFIKLLEDIEKYIIGNPTIGIETIFWYLTLKKFLKVPLNTKDDGLFTQILTFELISTNTLGFALSNPSIDKKTGKKDKKKEQPSVIATFYALASLKYLGRLKNYFEMDSTFEKHDKLEHFLIEKRKNYQSVSIFFWLCINEILGKNLIINRREFNAHLNSSQDKEPELFRLLCILMLDLKSNVSQEQIEKFKQFEKPNGGYTFQNSAYPNISESFWIIYTIIQFHHLSPKSSGKDFAFVINELLKITPERLHNEEVIIQFAQLIVLLVKIWPPLIDQLEMIIFEGIANNGFLDLNILSEQSRTRGAEEQIINYINNKYKFKLSIQKIEVIYKRFLQELVSEPQVREFVEILYHNAQLYTEFDISEIRITHNKGKNRKNKITDEFLIKILQRMMEQHLFTGKIFSRAKRFIFTRFYFMRASFVEKIIISDRSLSIEAITKEKQHVQENLLDIYNYTREVEAYIENIFQEIESFLIAEEVERAKDRLNYNLNDAINNANMFKAHVIALKEGFALINPDFVFKLAIEKYEKAMQRLIFEKANLSMSLNIKIQELQDEIKQRKLVLTLDETINQFIGELGGLLGNFDKRFRDDIITRYSRQIVSDLENSLKEIQLEIEKMVKKIAEISKQITAKTEGISKLRRKYIERWESELDDFQKVINFYLDGINQWKDKVKSIDDRHTQFIARCEQIEKEINELLSKNRFNEAIRVNESKFNQIAEEVDKVTNGLKSDLEPIFKQSRKLNILYQKIPLEWTFLEEVIQKNIARMRELIGKYIQQDIKLSIKEELRLLIENKTLSFRNTYLGFENKVNSLISSDEPLEDKQILPVLNDIKQKLKTVDDSVQKKFLEISPRIPEFANDLKKMMKNWQQFVQFYEIEINRTESRIEEELIIKMTLELAKKRVEIHVTIPEIATRLHLEASKVETILKELINNERINAIILPNSNVIEVHNEFWSKSERLTQIIDVYMRELQGYAEKLEKSMAKALESKSFILSIPQLKAFLDLFAQKIQETKSSIPKHIKDLNIDINHKLFQKIEEDFQHKISSYELEIKNYSLIFQRAIDFNEFLIKTGEHLNQLIHNQLNIINQSLISRNKNNFEHNIKWFEEEKAKIEYQINLSKEQIESTKKQLWEDIPNADTITPSIYTGFETQMNEYIQYFNQACSEIEKNLSQNEIIKMATNMDTLITEKQNHLNQLLNQIEIDVHHRIHAKEYIIGANYLFIHLKRLDQEIKSIEKEIKRKNKQFLEHSKIFRVQNKILMANWNKYREDFEFILKERVMKLNDDLIEAYIKFFISSQKIKYMPIKMISDELYMLHVDIVIRIRSLINDGRLPGKIDSNNNVYTETSDEIDQETINLLNAMSFKAYLTFTRVSNVAKQLAPIVTLLGGLIGISYNLNKVYTNLLITIIPVIIVLLIFLGLFIKRGRDKALQHKIIKP